VGKKAIKDMAPILSHVRIEPWWRRCSNLQTDIRLLLHNHCHRRVQGV
jgi:hypothetical protein